jgi:hypothetical protein
MSPEKQEGWQVGTATAVATGAGSEVGWRRYREPVGRQAHRRGGRPRRGKLDRPPERSCRVLADTTDPSAAGPMIDVPGAHELEPRAWGFE